MFVLILQTVTHLCLTPLGLITPSPSSPKFCMFALQFITITVWNSMATFENIFGVVHWIVQIVHTLNCASKLNSYLSISVSAYHPSAHCAAQCPHISPVQYRAQKWLHSIGISMLTAISVLNHKFNLHWQINSFSNFLFKSQFNRTNFSTNPSILGCSDTDWGAL